MKKILFILIITIIFFESCRGYDDGPLISLRTPNARLEAHTWYVEQFLVDNTDSTDLYYTSCGHYILFYLDHATAEDLKFIKHCDCDKIVDNCSLTGAIGSYAGYVRKYLEVDYSGKINPFVGYVHWIILKLTNKYLWMKTTYKEKEYIIKAKAK